MFNPNFFVKISPDLFISEMQNIKVFLKNHVQFTCKFEYYCKNLLKRVKNLAYFVILYEESKRKWNGEGTHKNLKKKYNRVCLGSTCPDECV